MKKNKWLWLIIFLLIISFLIGGCWYFNNSKKEEKPKNNYEANKTSSSNNTDTSTPEKNSTPQEEATPPPKEPQYQEIPLSNFSTKIYSNDSSRQNNIQITCNSLNGTTVENGATFSFCNTVGQATTSKGYQKADIYDNNGNKKKGLGGGNCQVSSTLYNAVLAVSSLKVTERHAHSNNVPYVKKGKDAAVAFGSYDLKFVNNSGNTIKIYSSTDGKNVNISLVSLQVINQ